MSARLLLRFVVFATAVSLPAGLRSQGPAADAPPILVTGKAGPGLEAFDRAVVDVMDRHGIPGAALVIAKDGKLLYARGFGWADVSSRTPARAETPFGMASISKPITSLAVLKLVEDGKLGLDDAAFPILKHIAPPRGAARVDPRLARITVRHLLSHAGGWSRSKSGDPLTWTPMISRGLRVAPPITPEQFTSFMLTVPLDFDPGTRQEYSNVGYALLAQIIARVSGEPYEDYVRKKVLGPMGMRSARLHTTQPRYFPGEAKGYLAGSGVEVPPVQLPMMQGALGWSVSAVDMVRFLTALDGSRGKPFLSEKTFKAMLEAPPPPIKPRDNGTYAGLAFHITSVSKDGIAYFQDGHYHGMRAFMKRSEKGVNWILTFNVSMQPDTADARILKDAVHVVREAVEAIKEYPKIDLFKDFP